MARIEDYALIGDCETAALVSKEGSIDWLCWPRFDSGACFAALVGRPDNGFWRIAPSDHVTRTTRRYRGDTLILETTFETDLRDFASLERILWDLSEKVSRRLKNGIVSGSTVTLKLKTADFRQRTRSQSITAPTQLANRIFAIARDMLARETDGTAFRLIGVGVSALQPSNGSDDEDMLNRRSAHAERAMDEVRKRFGDNAVVRGIAYTTKPASPSSLRRKDP